MSKKGISFFVIFLLLSAFVPSIIPPVRAQSQNLWALIICGSTEGSFSNNTQYMYHVLTQNYTFDDNSVNYLDVYTDRPGVDALSNKSNVRSAITSWLASRSDENDIIFIYFSSHGGGYCPDFMPDVHGTPFNHELPYSMQGGRYDVSGDEGNEVNENSFRIANLFAHPILRPWPLDVLIDWDGDGFTDDRLRDIDLDHRIELDINDDNIWDGRYTDLADIDGDGTADDFFADVGTRDQCDVLIDADLNGDGIIDNWVSDGEDINNDGYIVGVDLNGNGDNNDWVGIDECMQVQDGLYWDDELRNDLNELDYAKLIFVRQGCVENGTGCFGGGLIDDISGANRIIMTATDETHHSYGDIDFDGFSEWSEVFIDALYGREAHYDPINHQVVPEATQVDADENDDGHVSMWEAWDYAWNNDDARPDEEPWLDDNGDGYPTYELERDVLTDWLVCFSDGLLSMETYFGFDNLKSPDLNDDAIVDIVDIVLIALAYGSRPSHGNWDPRADLMPEWELIDMVDLVYAALHFGEWYPSTRTRALTGGTAVLSLYPDTITAYKDETFSVNVTITNATDLYGWEFKLYWNNTILNCTGAEIHTLDIWSGKTGEVGPGIQNNLSTTQGMYWKAMAALYPAPSFNGSMTIATLTFKAIATGTTILDLQDTKLIDSKADIITLATEDGSVIVLYGRYMRGDTDTVNNLTAYVLNATKSSIAQNRSRSDSLTFRWPIGYVGATKVYYGIRVWVRHANGTETELTGGIPVAKVSRNQNGQGIQTATWNCPPTSVGSTDALVVRVYIGFYIVPGGYVEWPSEASAEFITEQLEAEQLVGSTWTIYYYTKCTFARAGPSTWEVKGYFYWGINTYNSRIENIQYT